MRHHNSGNRPYCKVLGIQNQAFTLLGRFILHEANKITVIFCCGPYPRRKDRLATESVGAVLKGCRGLGFIIKLHNAIKAEGPLGVKGSRVDVARWMARDQLGKDFLAEEFFKM